MLINNQVTTLNESNSQSSQSDEPKIKLPKLGIGCHLLKPGAMTKITRLLIVGRSGSGKTTHAMAIFKMCFLPYIDDVYIVSPTATTRDPLSSIIMEYTAPENIYSNATSEDVFREILYKIETQLAEDSARTSLLFVDDMAAESSTNRGRKGPFADLVIRAPHLNLNIVGLFQQTKTASASLRDNAEWIILFEPTTVNDLRTIQEEFSPYVRDRKLASQFIKQAYKSWDAGGFICIMRPHRARVQALHNLDYFIEQLHET